MSAANNISAAALKKAIFNLACWELSRWTMQQGVSAKTLFLMAHLILLRTHPSVEMKKTAA
ncbi:hypothetical protein PJE062_3774 [Pseudovibrio sp. JE062]|nr:hypothetical protein PJE062_3774 [Pseudovibrio sp. JE062]